MTINMEGVFVGFEEFVEFGLGERRKTDSVHDFGDGIVFVLPEESHLGIDKKNSDRP